MRETRAESVRSLVGAGRRRKRRPNDDGLSSTTSDGLVLAPSCPSLARCPLVVHHDSRSDPCLLIVGGRRPCSPLRSSCQIRASLGGRSNDEEVGTETCLAGKSGETACSFWMKSTTTRGNEIEAWREKRGGGEGGKL